MNGSARYTASNRAWAEGKVYPAAFCRRNPRHAPSSAISDKPMQGGQSLTMTQSNAGVGSPISNEAYNILTALQSKLEGLEAYRKYSQSGSNSDIWQQ